MKRLLTVAITLMIFTVAITLLCTGCASSADGGASLSVGTLPEITTEAIAQGTLFLRCSEPEDNCFSIQFVGAVPTNYVDYVGFEACIVYADGTRGTRSTVKLHTLYRAIEDEEGNPLITSEDFGIEDGYLFVRALDRVPTDEEGLSYEVAAYYVLDNKKYYTAKQTFLIQDLLEEHILSNPEPFSYQETSEVIEVQKWVKQTGSKALDDPALSRTYYLGASLPDSNGNLKMFVCFAVPTLNNNTVGIRYNFTQQDGIYEGVSTSLSRARTKLLYSTVITETETLTIADFGLSEGYLAVIPFETDVNILTRQGFDFNIELHFSHNAVETSIAKDVLDFTEIAEKTVLTREGVSVSPYTYIPTNYHEWNDFNAEAGNAVGTGTLRIRMTDATNVLGIYKFTMQLATAIPTRFAQRVAYVYTAYDKDGNVVGLPNCEVNASIVYASIFDNGDETMDSTDFGIERGYIMSMALNNIEYDHEIASIKLEAYYMKNNEKNYVASLTIELETLREMISVIE